MHDELSKLKEFELHGFRGIMEPCRNANEQQLLGYNQTRVGFHGTLG